MMFARSMQYAGIILAIFMLSACAGTGKAPTDRQVLYEIKSKWTKAREVVITKYALGDMSAADYDDFKTADRTFSVVYDQAYVALIKGQTGTASWDELIDDLQARILLLGRQHPEVRQ